MDEMCNVMSAHVRRQRGGERRGAEPERTTVRKMAGKPGHAAESLAAERRLRPIYDLLDCGSNKKALQEVDKVLRKWPKLQCARALKSLATLRLGRAQDALVLIDALAQDLPTDDSTLLVMTIVYRETHRFEKICRIYEAAVKKEPTSEDLHTHLFMANVRVGDLEKQHHTSMALYKLKSKNPYYFWAVMSLVLQATKGVGNTDPIKRNICLVLAQRMVDKFINENKLEAEQEVQLYLMILQLQNKYKEALEFLESPLGRKLMPGALPQASLPFLVKLEKWGKLNILCKELIWDSPDRWDFYMSYFQSSFELMKKLDNCDGAENDKDNKSIKENNVNSANVKNNILEYEDDSSEKCHEFLCQIVENTTEKGKILRGPYLARLELYKRLRIENKDPEGLMGNAADLLVDYFRVFGNKACSVGDLRPYISLVEETKKDDLAQRFINTFLDTLMDSEGENSVSLPQNNEQMQRHICSLQLSRICGRQAVLSEEHARTLVGTLALHCERATLCPPRSPTERTPYDPYSLLAAHLCYDIALKCSSSKPLIEALYLLEYVLKSSPSNFHCKLLCIKFYHMLGCGIGAHSIYESLDVKHVQLDSLGHLHVALLGSCGIYNLATAAYDATHKFFTHAYKDSDEHLTFSYKYGSFMKLEELMEWRERLHGSLQRALVLIERTVLSIVTASSHTAAVRALSQASLSSPENVINWENLRDNRDLGVFTNWDPLTIEDKEAPTKQFNQDKSYVKIKYLLLQCLISCSNIVSVDKSDTDNQKQVESLEETVKEFLDYFELLQSEKLTSVNQISVTSPLPSRILGFVNSSMPFKDIYLGAFTAVIMYAKNKYDTIQTTVNECEENFNKSMLSTCDMLDQQINNKDPLWTCRTTLETLVNFIEVTTAVMVIAGVCADLIKQTNSKKVKKKGAGSNFQTEPAPVEPISSLLETLSSSITKLTNKLDLWETPEGPKDLSEHFSNLSIVMDDSNPVAVKLKDSHMKSLTSLKHILKEKLKYIAAINI